MITKSVQQQAPYSSGTFNANNNFLVGANGVLAGGMTTTSGSTVTVQPLTWIQNGLIVNSSTALTVTLPPSITAPYFVAVTTSSAIENPSEVVTPTFVKRPEDVSAGTVLVAEWDGAEWRNLPYLSPSLMHEAGKQGNINGQLVGIATGFGASQDSGHIYIDPGTAIAADGSPVTKTVTTTLTKIAADADGLNRIDEVVLRKPLDNPARIATIQYVIGPAFNNDGSSELFAAKQTSSVGAWAPKILNSPTSDALYIFNLEGTSPTANLKFLTAATATTTPTAVSTIASSIDNYDAVLTPDGFLDVVYTQGVNLFYTRITTTGTVVYAASNIYTSATSLTNPKLVTVASGAGYYIHIVVQKYVSGSQNQIGYVRLDSTNSVSTTFQVLVDLSAALANPSLAKDDDDAIFLLAFESQTTQAAFLYTFDASTATSGSAPTQVGLPITLQDNTYDLSTATLLASTGATNVIVRRAANKETFVFWRHNKGGSTYGVAVYNENYLNEFGYKAIVKDLYTTGENVNQYDVSVDGLNVAHFILRESGLAGAANLRLTDLTVSEVQQVLASGATDVRVKFSSLGALIFSYGVSSASYMAKSTAGSLVAMRNLFLPPTDVYLVHYRTGDGTISVAGTALEEDPSIQRLYEFNNLFAATGTVTWSGSSTHLLTVQANLTINFFNRLSTYTIPSNSPSGITVPDGSVCYVNVPDTDAAANLTLEVTEFGEGILDRYGRTAVPLFWSIGGVLYTKFAPFRLDSGGETIIIGDPLSTAQLTWLGMPSNPDPTSHGYASTTYITQSTDNNSAIGLLDEAITGLSGQFQYVSNVETLSSGITSYSVVFGTAQSNTNYSIAPQFENTVDAHPMFQPMTITAKSVNGFTVSWNVALDSANYKLDWVVSYQPPLNGVVSLSAGVTSVVVTFSAARGTPNYRLALSMENVVDTFPQYQPITITNKTVNGFTASWNVATDSANYRLGYLATS